MLSEQFEFHLEEFRQLKAEIATLLARIGFLFRNSIIASTVLYSWFLTKVATFSGSSACLSIPKELAIIAIWVPPVFVLASLAFAILTYNHIAAVGSYLLICEQKLGSIELGWEKYWATKRPALSLFLLLIWMILVTGCIIASYKIGETLNNLDVCKSAPAV